LAYRRHSRELLSKIFLAGQYIVNVDYKIDIYRKQGTAMGVMNPDDDGQ
jgi:hypothetical protein